MHKNSIQLVRQFHKFLWEFLTNCKKHANLRLSLYAKLDANTWQPHLRTGVLFRNQNFHSYIKPYSKFLEKSGKKLGTHQTTPPGKNTNLLYCMSEAEEIVVY